MPPPASATKPSIFEFQKPSMSTLASASKRMSIFDFSKPLTSSPASTSIFDFHKPGTSALGSSGKPGTSGLGSAPNLSIFDFQTSGKSAPALRLYRFCLTPNLMGLLPPAPRTDPFSIFLNLPWGQSLLQTFIGTKGWPRNTLAPRVHVNH